MEDWIFRFVVSLLQRHVAKRMAIMEDRLVRNIKGALLLHECIF